MENLEGIAAAAGLALERRQGALALTDGSMAVRGEFTRMVPRLRPDRLGRELLVKAAKVKVKTPAGSADTQPLRAVDATAGLGEDALLLAAAGFHVTLFERNPLVAALLEDALRRAADDPALAQAAARMQLVCGDGATGLAGLGFQPDVVYLDPMFPAKGKDAAAKKKLQLLQRLEQPCADEAALLDAALDARPRKVVVKRPAKGPWLGGHKPSYTLSGKAIRFDVYAVS